MKLKKAIDFTLLYEQQEFSSTNPLGNVCSYFRVYPNATSRNSVTNRKWQDEFPHEPSPNNVPAMATVQVCVLFLLLSVSLAEDVKLKYKPATKPVRLFTEEELQRYDGREVNFFLLLVYDCNVHWMRSHLLSIALRPFFRRASLFTWQ